MSTTTRLQAITMRAARFRNIAFWVCTIIVVFENVAGAVWVFTPLIPGVNKLYQVQVFASYLQSMLTRLGYPSYFEFILGPWQLACAVALIWPRLPRAKEWAYVGAFFNYSSAFFSHLFSGDGLGSCQPLVFAIFTVLSWALRPSDRRLTESGNVEHPRQLSWLAAAGILMLLFFLSFTWLPKAPNQ